MTIPTTAKVLLRGQLAYLREQGFEITVISSPGPELDLVARREQVRTIGVAMEREIDPLRDAIALATLVRVLRELRPDLVNASTSKAGMLGMIAAKLLGVPSRIYLLRGLRLETERGAKRAVLGAAERVAVACAHDVICVSESLRQRFVEAGHARPAKCRVLGAGSSNGVEVERFAPSDQRRREALELRDALAIPRGVPVIGFVGRPVEDKGIDELLGAFRIVLDRHPDARLLLVGAGFANDHLPPALEDALRAIPNVILVGRVEEPAPYYAMMSVLAFPSHREGFPNAPLEAAAAGVPTVGARATGVIDAIVDGETGLLVPLHDESALATAVLRYLDEPALRARHGEAARVRAVKELAREIVWARWNDEYRRLIRRTGWAISSTRTR